MNWLRRGWAPRSPAAPVSSGGLRRPRAVRGRRRVGFRGGDELDGIAHDFRVRNLISQACCYTNICEQCGNFTTIAQLVRGDVRLGASRPPSLASHPGDDGH